MKNNKNGFFTESSHISHYNFPETFMNVCEINSTNNNDEDDFKWLLFRQKKLVLAYFVNSLLAEEKDINLIQPMIFIIIDSPNELLNKPNCLWKL